MPHRPSQSALEASLDDVRTQVSALIAGALGVGDEVREGLDWLAASIAGLTAVANVVFNERVEENQRIDGILDVIYGLARLDFSRRAPVRGDGPLDALAASANMLAEELEVAQRSLADAKGAAEMATAAKTQFLARMSHEIRTPLTALLGFADLLGAKTLTESDRLNYAMIIRRNGEHLLSVINDILDVSKIEAGKLVLELIPCSLADVLSDVESLMRVRAAERALALSVALETAIPSVVITDPTRLRQILLNLAGNAIKFTEHGGVRILARFDLQRSMLTVAVHDTGIGIQADQLSRLFEPFEQADVSMSRRFGGSGMGLSICKSLANALGGDISVHSEIGNGSIFTVSVRCNVVEGAAWIASFAPDVMSPAAPAESGPVVLRGKVLLAEDGPDNQILITTLLRSYGLEVAVVNNGQLALDRTLGAARDGAPFDLVLMDMQMPVLDGYAATRQLRDAQYVGPILALTAHAMAGERERCLAVGCDGYLRKPLDRAEFVQTLTRILGQNEQTEQAPNVTAKAAESPPAASAPLRSSLIDDPVIGPLVRIFVEGMADYVASLRAAAGSADKADLARLLHQMKGAAAGFGFEPITIAAERAEALLVGEANPALFQAQLEVLVALCERARK